MVKDFKFKLLALSVIAVYSTGALADIISGGVGNINEGNETTLLIDDTGGAGAGASVLIDGDAGSVEATAAGGNAATLDGSGLSFNNNQGALTGVNTINGAAVSSFATTTQLSNLDRRIDDVSKTAYSGIASVAALAAIPGPAAGKQFSLGIGVGHFEGENAFAVGANAAVTPSLNVKVGVGHSSGNTTANAGASFSW